MNASLTTIVRFAGIALVVALAAILGLVAGNLLDSRDESPLDAGAQVDTDTYAAGPPAFADPYRRIMDAARGSSEDAWAQFQRIEHDAVDEPDGPPAYADPYRQIIDAADSAVDVTEEAWAQYHRIEHADADAFTQTWGNLDERRPAAAAAEEPNGSATAPTPR